MPHTFAAQGPPRVAGKPGHTAMRSCYLLGVRRWAVALTDVNVRRPAGNRLNRCSTFSSLSSAGTVPEAATLPELICWLQQQHGRVEGATLANLAGRDGGSGWGLKASQDVEQGQRLLLVPASCHLTYSAQDDPKLLVLIDKVPGELWGAKLALQLLAQRVRGPDSPFDAYIANLPKGVPGVPMFFSKRAIDLIDYPPVSQQVQKRCKWLFTFSQQVLAQLPGSPDDPFGGVAVDINALGWAMACVSSRAFRTRGPTQPAAMLPLIDMANHSFSPNAEVLPAEGSAVGLFARRKIAAGEPLLLSYGKLSNDFLFMDYGFIVADNPYDTVQLRFDVGLLQAGALVANVTDVGGAPLDLTPGAAWKQALLADLGLAGPGANTELNLGGPSLIDGRLMAAARILVARQEGEVAGRGVERLCDLNKPLSQDNEAAALRIVAGVVAVALSNFSTSLDLDIALLAAFNGGDGLEAAQEAIALANLQPLQSEDEALSVRFRIEKKKVLKRALEQLAEMTKSATSNAELRKVTGLSAAKKGTKPAPATVKGFGKK